MVLSAGALAVVNPFAAGGRAARLWRQLESAVRAGFPELGVRFTTAPGEAEAIAHDWGLRNARGVLLVAGGDGTLHEAVNGLFRSESRAQLGVIPVGSGNDFARNAGIPLDPREALRALQGSPPRSVDLGHLAFQADSGPAARVFLNSVSLGVSVHANRLAQSLPRRGAARLRYGLAGLAAVLWSKPSRYLVTCGDRVLLEGLALNLTVANGAYFGGGMRISPDSSPADGTLELVVLGPLSRLRALQALSQLRAGTHLALREVSVTRLREPLRIASTGPTLRAEADGEEIEVAGGLTIRVLPAALALLNAPS
ncbi:MAG TPA: diacylglycerol kinase family protein [Gemmatimonadales bacterium]|jgi:YegS/Rv2252/BmrU family lipid kinase|nr:diacylglycerol kinase family protein [Gemmatimonadales bacterium]